ncbi:hypothetical protein K458DRAFT_158540 [Lentithecium fluviatile CBS 122367]|uniref:Chromo domain-containing protein n=1 Tax=Lentithecium fluviatile CBS 122367 TaxID=1168545 RepID=A0A6G1IHJ5_9PLEO|nr:hypothetical protein K458DRAFT_158540 [Lentithecium fluviatile CBS 122367]
MILAPFQTQKSRPFVFYKHPKPKPTLRRKPLQKPRHKDVCLDPDKNSSTRPALTSNRAGDISLASAGQNICQLEEFGSGCGDIGCTGGLTSLEVQEVERFLSDCFSEEVLREGSAGPSPFKDSSQYDLPQNERQSGGLEYSLTRRASRGSKKSAGQSAPVKGSSQNNSSTQKHDHSGDAGLLTSDHHDTDVERSENRVSGPPRREVSAIPSTPLTPPTPPTEPSIVEMGQPTQEACDDSLLEAIAPQSQRLVPKMADKQGKRVGVLTPSSGSGSNGSGSDTETDDDDNDDSASVTKQTRKRERSPPAKRHSQSSNTVSKQCTRHAEHSVDQNPPSCSQPLANCSPRSKTPSAAQYSGHDTERFYNDDSSDSSSSRHHRTKKRQKLVNRSSKQQKRIRHVALEDDEYEVEKILNARVYSENLQYRIKWRGYKVDRK